MSRRKPLSSISKQQYLKAVLNMKVAITRVSGLSTDQMKILDFSNIPASHEPKSIPAPAPDTLSSTQRNRKPGQWPLSLAWPQLTASHSRVGSVVMADRYQ